MKYDKLRLIIYTKERSNQQDNSKSVIIYNKMYGKLLEKWNN